MKHIIRLCIGLCLVIMLASWGKIGHFTVGRIAEKHLSDKSKAAIHDLIGDTSLADISTWADEIRQKDAYKYTFYYHFIDLPLGYSQGEFNKAVVEQTRDNVYSALSKYSFDLIEPGKTKAERVFALKMIVHLVGDLHQPMHVSREEDQGGNTIKISFLGKPGNLHGLWDSNLIEHAGLTDQQLAAKVDHATPEQISQWQQDGILQWLFESYQVSTQLYADAARNPDFDEAYYKAHMPLIEDRLEKGGIRLAGLLNEIFSGGPYKIVPPPRVLQLAGPTHAEAQAVVVASKEVAKHMDETVTTTGTIVSTRLIESNQMTLLNVGGDNPNQDFTIVIRKGDRSKFGKPDVYLKGKTVTVTGKVVDYKGMPEIVVSETDQIVVR